VINGTAQTYEYNKVIQNSLELHIKDN